MKKSQNHRGRLIHRDQRGSWVTWGEHIRRIHVQTPSTASPGDYVELQDVRLTRDSWTCETMQTIQSYGHTIPFPPPHSDWNRFHGNGGPSPETLRKVAQLRAGVRSFFNQAGFLEVDTPAINCSPGLEVHLDAIEARGRVVAGGPIQSQWLMTSPEYHMKRVLSADIPKIYQLCKSFRSGESGPLHNPEFTMLEWYRSFADWKAGPQDTLHLIQFLANKLELPTDLPGIHGPLSIDRPWLWLSVRDAVGSYVGFDPFPWEDAERNRSLAGEAGIHFSSQDRSAEEILTRILVDGVEPNLPNDRFTVLTHYPPCMASLAQLTPDGEASERFEIYAGGVELANGFGELTSWTEQKRRLHQDLESRGRAGLPVYPVDESFLEALRTGVPPSMGIALGFDRLAMVFLGISTLQELLLFPAVPTGD